MFYLHFQTHLKYFLGIPDKLQAMTLWEASEVWGLVTHSAIVALSFEQKDMTQATGDSKTFFYSKQQVPPSVQTTQQEPLLSSVRTTEKVQVQTRAAPPSGIFKSFLIKFGHAHSDAVRLLVKYYKNKKCACFHSDRTRMVAQDTVVFWR